MVEMPRFAPWVGSTHQLTGELQPTNPLATLSHHHHLHNLHARQATSSSGLCALTNRMLCHEAGRQAQGPDNVAGGGPPLGARPSTEHPSPSRAVE
jgi:hypothetical protein